MPADPVISALEEQVDCYQRLAKLAEIQHEHVQHSRTEALLEVLGKRQEVLTDVSRLEHVIGPAVLRRGRDLPRRAGRRIRSTPAWPAR